MHSFLFFLLSAAVLASADSRTLALRSEPGPLNRPWPSAANRALHKAGLTIGRLIGRPLVPHPCAPTLSYSATGRGKR
jgi:hypothetical protein